MGFYYIFIAPSDGPYQRVYMKRVRQRAPPPALRNSEIATGQTCIPTSSSCSCRIGEGCAVTKCQHLFSDTGTPLHTKFLASSSETEINVPFFRETSFSIERWANVENALG